MILGTLFIEFFKIGLFAIGGGLVTIPFLFDLTQKFDWFTPKELTDMIAVSQSTPGPIGINMATYAGFKAAGTAGGIVATLGLTIPSLIIVIFVSKLLKKYAQNNLVDNIMSAVRPAGIALIFHAGVELCRLSIITYQDAILALIFFVIIYFYKKSPLFYIILSALTGIILQL